MTTTPKSQGAAIDQAGAPAALSPVEIDAKLYASLQHVGGALCDAVPFREVKAFADHFAASLLAAPAGDAQQASDDASVLAHGHRDDYYLLANARRLAATSVRAIMNTTNWHFAAQLFAIGSNSAYQICVDAGIDPYGFTVDRASQANKAGLDGGAR